MQFFCFFFLNIGMNTELWSENCVVTQNHKRGGRVLFTRQPFSWSICTHYARILGVCFGWGVDFSTLYLKNACCLGASNVCRPTKSRVSYNQICGDAMYIRGMRFFFFFLRQMKQGLFHCQKTCKVTETQKKLVTKNLRTNSLLYGSYLVTHAYIGMTFGEACTLHRQITGLAISWALWYEHAYAKVHKYGFYRFQTHKYRWT